LEWPEGVGVAAALAPVTLSAPGAAAPSDPFLAETTTV
jgi:hypothetical protein